MTLKEKIENRSATVGIIGLGYVGLSLAMEFIHAGFKVKGFDIDKSKVEQLNKGNNYIQDVSDEDLNTAVNGGQFKATTDFSEISTLNTVSICVPTPLNKQKNPDISYINSAMSDLCSYIHADMLIILESTTYPGTTRELILPILEGQGFKVGTDFFLCFSPERIDPGNKKFGTTNTPKVIGGITKKCTEHGIALYNTIVNKVVPVSSPEAAEMVKLLENTFRAINIGLANETAIMCEKLGMDVWEIIEAAATKPFGFMKFTPGPGLGGHCIPIDPHYLSWKLKALDYDARFIQLAGEINTSMPIHVVDLVRNAMNAQKKALNGSSILIVGVAYKKNVNDVRESPAIDVIKLLDADGVNISFYDPYVESIYFNGRNLKRQENLIENQLDSADAVVILTDHDSIDFNLILSKAKLIVDTRNVYHRSKEKKLFRLGVGTTDY
ncbi:MAG: UDP-N-acetyl-D-glucosamine dehydrogenase [Candidatus Marinimicrobia bacterium]|nr:UDP-N-acetyl-D-glucosamine dehydrogenase [Candidatus Neomarinimicrobiota bacterium]|tara:strand:+ start:908 stop:2227 length:1320 start_codon:yes stop_codon:yes gene_type:complete